jgi:hypothetical protein
MNIKIKIVILNGSINSILVTKQWKKIKNFLK